MAQHYHFNPTPTISMAPVSNLNAVSETLPAIPKLLDLRIPRYGTKIIGVICNKMDEFQRNPLQTTRRVALGSASIAFFGNLGIKTSLAEDNGFWLTGPIPVPSAENKIANEETGTRSFLKNGIYMAKIGKKGTEYRLKKYAFDLLALGDMIGQDTWNYIRKYLRLKSTFMYYDFDKVITAAAINDKQSLTDLANKLFNNVEKLEDAVKMHDLPKTRSCYQDTTTILQEVMDRMA